MANEDLNFETALQQAPPAASTVENTGVLKDEASAQAARQLSDVTSQNPVKTGFDMSGLANAAPKPEGPAPGSIAWRLTNALKSPSAQKGGGGTLALFGSVTDALLHGNPEASAAAASTAAATPGSGADAWSAAQSNADATRPTQAPIAAPRKNFIDSILAQVGDVAAASKERSAIAGFAKAVQAGSQREREEQADRIALAHSNSQMLHEQALTHKMGEDAINASAATGKQGADAILTSHIPGQLIAEGKTSDEVKQMIDSGEIKPTEQTVFLTGRKLTGTDKNGQPMFRSTYTVVKPGGPVDLTDRESEVKFIKDNTGTDLKGENGKITQIPAVQFNQLWQQASNAALLKRAAQVKEAGDNKVINESQNSEAARQMIKSQTLLNAMNGHTSVTKEGQEDPFAVAKTYNYVMNNPKIRQQIEKETGASNFSEAYSQYAGGEKRLNELLQDYTKAQEKNVENSVSMLDKIEKNPESMVGKTDALIPALQAMINNPASYATGSEKPESIRKRAIDQLAIVREVAKNELETANKKETGKQKAQNEAELGDVDELIDAAKNYDIDPEKMFGNRVGMRAAFMNKFLKETGGQWNEADYKTRYQTKQDFRPSGKSGQEVRSLNTFAGHVGTAVDRIPELNNSKLPDWNTAMNKIAVKVGDEQYGRMQTALEAVKDEYLNFIKNQHAPTKEELERAESILNPNMSPKTIHGVLAQMADTVGVRGGQLQRSYMNTMGGKAYAGMLDPDSDKILKGLGVDTDKMNGISKTKTGQKIGDAFMQNGHQYKITAIDANGNITGAE